MFSKNFRRKEFSCKCGCGFNTVDAELLHVLEDVREKFGSPVVIRSGCRCEKHNRRVGGKKNSMHLSGKAADISVIGIMPGDVAAYLRGKYDFYGIGDYVNFTHTDVRTERARWDG